MSYKGRVRDATGMVNWNQMMMMIVSMMTVDLEAKFKAIYSKLYSVTRFNYTALNLIEVRHIKT